MQNVGFLITRLKCSLAPIEDSYQSIRLNRDVNSETSSQTAQSVHNESSYIFLGVGSGSDL